FRSQYERKDEGEDERPLVSHAANQFVTKVSRIHDNSSDFSSPVSRRNASSSPAPAISMSQAVGKSLSTARIAASEFVQCKTTASPRSSAVCTPSSWVRVSTGTFGNVALIVRSP